MVPPMNLLLFPLVWTALIDLVLSVDQGSSVVVSSFSLPHSKIEPYDWLYMRVELPLWFSSMTMDFQSDASIDTKNMGRIPYSSMPMICLRDGGPPLPDVSNSSLKNLVLNYHFNGSIEGIQNLHGVGHCLPFQNNITMTLTNEQISPGVWYIGFFNGIGPARTQSKMINRGQAYMFSTNVTVQGCTTPTIWGPYCNLTIDQLTCFQNGISKHPRSLLDVVVSNNRLNLDYAKNTGRQMAENPGTMGNTIMCNNSFVASCLGHGESKIYSLDILDATSEFKIVATELGFNQSSTLNNTVNSSEILLMCYARYNSLPLSTVYDYSADINNAPLIIEYPEIGRWYIVIQAINRTKTNQSMQSTALNSNLCFSLEWQIHQCPFGKAGPNCTWEGYVLQRFPKKNRVIPFESYYLPIGETMPTDSPSFPLGNLLSNSSSEDNSDVAWTYFIMGIPHGAAGANLRVSVTSDRRVHYEIFARFGGFPTINTWDHYANSMNSSNDSMLLVANDSSGQSVDFYILYAREGTWNFGLRHLIADSRHQTTLSISLDGCPKHCSYHGTCHFDFDESGLSSFSYCFCDRDHGGFDCSVELVSRHGHIVQSVFLIASNAAAILPSFWALRQKAFSEWVLFTSSGISSGLYHACDVGTWCALSFHVLQFLDFWLSFMAVVSTFVYMTTIDDSSKRAIQTGVSILTALLAETGATKVEM
ncbi:hypothetical protein QJS10_CPA09g01744 [Acorus calamus]|uniref:EGF-like domain-containing protein n=1 Tax=Acorus calamus TaxID=4465 RepID=A0AAV9E3U4_ACOCL|nr:hypothetical protein QJS10_CPA09g01744 [Acorus calamus]